MHLAVKIIRNFSEWLISKSHAQKNPLGFVTQQPKFITLTQLIANSVTFIMYFLAIGLVLQEMGVNLKFTWAAPPSSRWPSASARRAWCRTSSSA